MNNLGIHYILELTGCSPVLLNNLEFVKNALVDSAQKANATVISQKFNTFNPHGISGFLVIAESHISIHTWPEFGYAAIDVFTCGHHLMTETAANHLKEQFKADQYLIYKLYRGMMDERGNNLSNSSIYVESKNVNMNKVNVYYQPTNSFYASPMMAREKNIKELEFSEV